MREIVPENLLFTPIAGTGKLRESEFASLA